MALKVNISDPKTGRTAQVEASEDATKKFVGMHIGETFKGELLDCTGYEFTITGGSDLAGFPLRADIPGTGRRKILTYTGVVGVKKKNREGVKVRKTVNASVVDNRTVQLNVKISKAGKEPIAALQPPAPEPAEGEATEEKKE